MKPARSAHFHRITKYVYHVQKVNTELSQDNPLVKIVPAAERQGQADNMLVNHVPPVASPRVELWNVLSVSWVLVHRKRVGTLVKHV